MGDISARRPQNDPVRLGVYKHYKHTKEDPKYYLIVGVGAHTRSQEKLVACVPLYPAGGPRLRFRPLDEFTETVTVNGASAPRFEYVGTEIPEYSV